MARKLKAQKPPLSAVDALLYCALALIFLVVGGVMLYRLAEVPHLIAFRRAEVVASTGEWIILASLPLFFLIFVGPAVFVSIMLEKKQPLLGNKNFKAKFGQASIKVEPLLSKAFWQNLSPRHRRILKRVALLLAILLAVSVALIPLGIYPRTELDRDDVITRFNAFNKVTETHRIEDAEEVDISIDLSGGKGVKKAYITMTFEFEDDEYDFTIGSFRDMSTEESLRYMIRLKGLVDESRLDIDARRMERLLRDRDYTDAEIALVYELFDYAP